MSRKEINQGNRVRRVQVEQVSRPELRHSSGYSSSAGGMCLPGPPVDRTVTCACRLSVGSIVPISKYRNKRFKVGQ